MITRAFDGVLAIGYPVVILLAGKRKEVCASILESHSADSRGGPVRWSMVIAF